ncbi:MAG: NMD3-related protein [Candidatus Njordarchaeales archaeon]
MSYRCPLCGKKTQYRTELHGLCEDCYAKIHGTRIREEPKVTVTICNLCQRIKFGNSWIKPTQENLKTVVRSSLKKMKPYKDRKYDFHFAEISRELLREAFEEGEIVIPFQLLLNNMVIKETQVTVNFAKAICPLCMKKKMGSYFEYVIHVRFSGSKMRDYINEINKVLNIALSHADPSVFIDVRKVSKGLDIRVSDRRIGRLITQQLRNRLMAEVHEYSERRFDATLKKQVIIKKVTLEV